LIQLYLQQTLIVNFPKHRVPQLSIFSNPKGPPSSQPWILRQ
jgi:hypothetical protein